MGRVEEKAGRMEAGRKEDGKGGRKGGKGEREGGKDGGWWSAVNCLNRGFSRILRMARILGIFVYCRFLLEWRG